MRAMLLPVLMSLAVLTACDRQDDQTGVTAGEAEQLNAAADMLDINASEPTETTQ